MNRAGLITDARQLLARLGREGTAESEVSLVVAPGTRAQVWAGKVTALVEYNVYQVVMVSLGSAGSVPVEIGEAVEAVNLAEPFDQAGTLPAGRFVVVCRVGEKNVFYAPV